MADSGSSGTEVGVVVLADGIVTLTLTDLGPVPAAKPRLTPTGRPRRTRAEISAGAAERRQRNSERKARRAAALLEARLKRTEEKKARVERAEVRRKAAMAKHIEYWRKQQVRADKRRGCNQIIVPKPETPHHLFRERLQDDPDKIFCNHVVDTGTLDGEDTLIAWLDGDGTELEETVEALLSDLRVEESWANLARQTERLKTVSDSFRDDPKEVHAWNREEQKRRNLTVFHNPDGRRRFAV
ncbi:MAG: hypothetical protein AAB473_03160 [Patescibacteria group bacterium]